MDYYHNPCKSGSVTMQGKCPTLLVIFAEGVRGKEGGLQFPQDTERSQRRRSLAAVRDSESKSGPWLCENSRGQVSLRAAE